MCDNYDEIQRFSSIIFERVKRGNLDYLDSIVSYCEEHAIEVDTIVDLISPSLKAEIEQEALSLRLITSTTQRLTI